MLDNEFDKAEELFCFGNYDLSLAAFKNIAENYENSSRLRADALNMIGVLLSGPLSGSSYESHMDYFKSALSLDPENQGALMNVIELFGDEVNQHQDIQLLKNSVELVRKHYWSELSEEERARVIEKDSKVIRSS